MVLSTRGREVQRTTAREGKKKKEEKYIYIYEEMQRGDLRGYDDVGWANCSIGVCSYRFYFATTCVKMNVPHHCVGGEVL